MANTQGLIQITLLLGYGLVELPRAIWRDASPEDALQRHRLLVVREYRCRDDARTQLQLALDDVYRYQRLLSDTPMAAAKKSLLNSGIQGLLVNELQLFTEEENRRAKVNHE